MTLAIVTTAAVGVRAQTSGSARISSSVDHSFTELCGDSGRRFPELPHHFLVASPSCSPTSREHRFRFLYFLVIPAIFPLILLFFKSHLS